MNTFMIWYRTAGTIKTVKIQAKTEGEAIKKFKAKHPGKKPFRTLKLKAKSRPAKRSKKLGTSAICKKEAASISGNRRRKRKTKRKKLSGTRTRNLTLVPGEKAKSEAKDKLKNNIIIYGAKRRKRGTTMRRGKNKGVQNIIAMLMQGLIGAAAGIGGGAISNMAPIPIQLKPFLPILLAAGIDFVPALDAKLKNSMAVGLVTLSAAALIKQYFPQLPQISGEGQLTQNDLDLLGFNAADDDLVPADELGEMVDVAGEMVSVGSDWITPADM